jgi:hypothetical protein
MQRLARSVGIEKRPLEEQAIVDLVAFLNALTGETATQGRFGGPDTFEP